MNELAKSSNDTYFLGHPKGLVTLFWRCGKECLTTECEVC